MPTQGLVLGFKNKQQTNEWKENTHMEMDISSTAECGGYRCCTNRCQVNGEAHTLTGSGLVWEAEQQGQLVSVKLVNFNALFNSQPNCL